MEHYTEYKTTDPRRVLPLVRKYPFATIMKNAVSSGVPAAVSAPVIESGVPEWVEFHMARANPAFGDFKKGGPALMVFHGPNAHVSPSWYKARFPKGAERSKTAPTWNYAEARLIVDFSPLDAAGLKDHLRRLVTHFEAAVSRGWSFDEMDPQAYAEWSEHIAGFSAKVVGATALFKFSQEQKPDDRMHVIAGLRDRATGFDAVLAEMMERFNYG